MLHPAAYGICQSQAAVWRLQLFMSWVAAVARTLGKELGSLRARLLGCVLHDNPVCLDPALRHLAVLFELSCMPEVNQQTAAVAFLACIAMRSLGCACGNLWMFVQTVLSSCVGPR